MATSVDAGLKEQDLYLHVLFALLWDTLLRARDLRRYLWSKGEGRRVISTVRTKKKGHGRFPTHILLSFARPRPRGGERNYTTTFLWRFPYTFRVSNGRKTSERRDRSKEILLSATGAVILFFLPRHLAIRSLEAEKEGGEVKAEEEEEEKSEAIFYGERWNIAEREKRRSAISFNFFFVFRASARKKGSVGKTV